MHARPDANIIRRNIAMHDLTEIVRIAAPATGAPRAGTSIAPLRHHASVAPVAPHARRAGAPRFPAVPIWCTAPRALPRVRPPVLCASRNRSTRTSATNGRAPVIRYNRERHYDEHAAW